MFIENGVTFVNYATSMFSAFFFLFTIHTLISETINPAGGISEYVINALKRGYHTSGLTLPYLQFVCFLASVKFNAYNQSGLILSDDFTP